jgi:hypothetical protein
VEARGQDRVGASLEEVNVKRGSAARYRVTPACRYGLPGCVHPRSRGREKSRPGRRRSRPLKNGKEGRFRREAELATGEGNPLKAKTQGRYRHETRPERLRAEQSVKRLRKPEGAAQPGEAVPVWVAACFCKRRRVRNPMKGGQGPFQ